MGLDASPELRMGRADVDIAGARRAGSIGRIGPRLSLDSRVLYWDAPTYMEFDMPPDMIDLFGTMIEKLGPMFPGDIPEDASLEFPPFLVQKRLTCETVLQAAQPLSPLYSLANAYKARNAAHKAARLDLEAARNTVRFNITEAFFRLRSIRSMVRVASMGVEQVEAHIKTARAFFKAGLVGRDDVLRAETALARVRDQLAQATSGEMLARAALNVSIGIEPGAATIAGGDYPQDPPPYDKTIDECLQIALYDRPELASVRHLVEAASAGHRAHVGNLFPSLSAVFRYSHQEGNEFMREDSYFIGGVLEWDFWQWGDRWYEMKTAEAGRDKALAGLDKARNGITLDVTRAWTDLHTAESSVEMNRKAIKSAEENLRVVNRKYEAGSATSVEALDAQSSLNQARSGFHVALFKYHTARANLERSMGVYP